MSSCSDRCETADVAREGRVHLNTFVVERCDRCGDLRIDHDIEVVGEVHDDDS
jgi:NAD-dependent SIR2 family protein deacetylase